MAEQLTNYTNLNRLGRGTKYPWDKWFEKGTTWKISQGKDFDCTVPSMHVQIRREALKQGKNVSVFKHGETEIVIVNKKPKRKRRTKNTTSK